MSCEAVSDRLSAKTVIYARDRYVESRLPPAGGCQLV